MQKKSTIFALRNRLHFVQSCDTFDSLSCRSQQHLEGEKMHQTGITMNNRQHYLTEPVISTLQPDYSVIFLFFFSVSPVYVIWVFHLHFTSVKK